MVDRITPQENVNPGADRITPQENVNPGADRLAVDVSTLTSAPDRFGRDVTLGQGIVGRSLEVGAIVNMTAVINGTISDSMAMNAAASLTAVNNYVMAGAVETDAAAALTGVNGLAFILDTSRLDSGEYLA